MEGRVSGGGARLGARAAREARGVAEEPARRGPRAGRGARAALLVALGLAVLAGGCGSSREIIPLNGPDGKPIRFVYRHEMRAKDAETRDSVVGALVGVRSSDDAVWQLSFTDANGGARLSQEYARTEVYHDIRYIFGVTTQDQVILRAPAFEMLVRCPAYEEHRQGYGANAFLDRPRLVPDPATATPVPAGVPPHAYAELVRPLLVPLDIPPEGGARPPTGTAAPPPALAALADWLGGASIEVRRTVEGYGGSGGGAFSVGPPVHDGRFARTTAKGFARERAAKVYYRVDDEAVVLLGGAFGPGESRASEARIRALADTAEVILHSVDALAAGEAPPSSRWVRADREPGARAEARIGVLCAALDAALAAGARRAAVVFPEPLLEPADRRLRERGFELLAEWWLPVADE
jgi:hypothetical protein